MEVRWSSYPIEIWAIIYVVLLRNFELLTGVEGSLYFTMFTGPPCLYSGSWVLCSLRAVAAQSSHSQPLPLWNTEMSSMDVTCERPTLSDLPPEVLESIFLLLGPRPVTWLAEMEDISLKFQAATAKVPNMLQSCVTNLTNFSFLSYLGTAILFSI